MADFNTALVARDAMRKSVESIFADRSLTEKGRTDMLLEGAGQYGEYLSIPLDQARGTVAKLAEGAGAPSAIIQKVAPAGHKTEQNRQAAERAASARRSLRRDSDPREEEPLREAAPEEVAKLMKSAIADGVAKIRAEHPRLSEVQARERFYTANPGVRKAMVEAAGRAYGSRGLGKGECTTGAQIEATAKAAELMKADPSLTEAQAYTRAYETTPGLMKRLLAEQRGER